MHFKIGDWVYLKHIKKVIQLSCAESVEIANTPQGIRYATGSEVRDLQEWKELIQQAKNQGITQEELIQWFETIKNRTGNAAQ